ncbi:cytochrome c oxidase assembly protein [Plantactinospora sp. GCM10030261]|uniref:cytochrome c oxidase assembly protein n=1 Tax=Plantactinospora sp. GCM10030261 TaxID=3273420 RepID=UPI0036199066
MTAGHDHAAGAGAALGPLLALVVLAAYLEMVAGQRRPGRRGWSLWRAASFTLGMLLIVVALTDPVASIGTATGHMLQHLLIGMLAPLALVLGAPMTLLLRSSAPAGRRVIGRLLHSRPARVVGHPVTALLLGTGGLYLLYVTPLYAATTRDPALHTLVHLHFLASGYLFAWVVAGPDPAPRRPGVPARLVVLGVSVAAHAVLSQLMYAGVTAVPAQPADLRAAATLMYYGGDLAEIALAVALLATWRPGRSARAVQARQHGLAPAAGAVVLR